MKPYRMINVLVTSVDKNGNTKTEAEWTIDINPGRGSRGATRFALEGCPHQGIGQIWEHLFRLMLPKL